MTVLIEHYRCQKEKNIYLRSKMNTFVYRGGGRDTVPHDATHVIMHESVKAIPAMTFYEHPNIIEVYCHVGVKKIESDAFYRCPRLKRVVMPGVVEVEWSAFYECAAIEYVECGNLERIGEYAFRECTSLSSINLPSAKVVDIFAFVRDYDTLPDFDAMTEVNFGADLEWIRERAFVDCKSLERVVIPLKNGMMTHDNVFQGCTNLKRIDLVEAEVLDETIAALQLEEWRNEMTAEVGSINQTLPNTDAGYYDERLNDDAGEKAIVIRDWISRVLSKIIRYKAQHVQLLEEAVETLKHFAPNDIVVDNVMPFLELPTHTFDGEDNS